MDAGAGLTPTDAERIYGDAQVQLGIAAPTPETGTVTPGAAKVRVCHDLKPWELSANATPSEFRRWRRKYEQYYLGSDIGVTNIPGQQATISGCVDRQLEQHLYNLISDNTPSSPLNTMTTKYPPAWTYLSLIHI